MKIIAIGIDPGSVSGAIAVISDDLHILLMKDKTEKEINEFIWREAVLVKEMDTKVFSVIERVNAFPGQGVVSMFRFGTNYGFLRGILSAQMIPFADMMPKEWQKHYSVTKNKGEVDKHWKMRLQNIAQNLYPKKIIPLTAADAVLIAHVALTSTNR